MLSHCFSYVVSFFSYAVSFFSYVVSFLVMLSQSMVRSVPIYGSIYSNLGNLSPIYGSIYSNLGADHRYASSDHRSRHRSARLSTLTVSDLHDLSVIYGAIYMIYPRSMAGSVSDLSA